MCRGRLKNAKPKAEIQANCLLNDDVLKSVLVVFALDYTQIGPANIENSHARSSSKH